MDYKKYSLENLENWLHDALSAGEASAEEVYNTIKKVVEEQYYHHKHHTSQAYELLALLNGNGIGHIKAYDDFWKNVDSDVKKSIEGCGYEWTPLSTNDKVIKWQLPVQVDGLTGDCYINLPDDLLERVGLKEGDMIEWIDCNDGSFELRKVNGTK